MIMKAVAATNKATPRTAGSESVASRRIAVSAAIPGSSTAAHDAMISTAA